MKAARFASLDQTDVLRVIALSPPLAVRLVTDDTATDRLLLLALALATAYAWAALFAHRMKRVLDAGPLAYALAFVVILPGPVAWGGAVLGLSFGIVFGREIFGGRPPLSPALIGLAFAVFSFPQAGYELEHILSVAPDPAFAIACLPGAALLWWCGRLAWPVAAGAVLGVLTVTWVMTAEIGWDHVVLGSFAAGVLFLAADPVGAPRTSGAQALQGLLVGVLIVLIRLTNPDQPDGVVFAALLGALFGPLLERALGRRPGHG